VHTPTLPEVGHPQSGAPTKRIKARVALMAQLTNPGS
jgi:hypothetical protein